MIRAFSPGDAGAIVALFAANDRAAVADPAADGFVQGGMTEERICFLAATGRVFVADQDGLTRGFVCSGPPSLPPGSSPLWELVTRAPTLRFRGRLLGRDGWIVYGPVVVGAALRGTGVARRLFEAVRLAWSGHAAAGVLFIEEGNRRSVAVHTEGLGIEPIGRFDLDGRGYLIGAFAIASPQDGGREG